jgi:hypothetical protein
MHFLLMKLLLFGQFQINVKFYIIKLQDFQFKIISHFFFSMHENMIKICQKQIPSLSKIENVNFGNLQVCEAF